MKKKFDAAAYQKAGNVKSRTYEVEMPSGFTFTLRRPNVQTFAASGVLPSGLFVKMLKSDKGGGKLIEDLTAEETVKSIEFSGHLVRAALVVPRIVENPQTSEEIRFEQLSDEDFTFIVNWCNAGGVEGDNLEKFRRTP